MNKRNNSGSVAIATAAVVAIFVGANRAQAHCDSLDGPVVKAAQRALAETNVNHVLIWVQKDDEAEVKRGFVKAYVEYVHYVEGLHEAAVSVIHGHFPEGRRNPSHPHDDEQQR